MNFPAGLGSPTSAVSPSAVMQCRVARLMRTGEAGYRLTHARIELEMPGKMTDYQAVMADNIGWGRDRLDMLRNEYERRRWEWLLQFAAKMKTFLINGGKATAAATFEFYALPNPVRGHVDLRLDAFEAAQ